MDSKFYVSLEAARLLKEKGYRDKTMYGYSSKDQSKNTLYVREDYDWNYPNDEFYSTETGEHVEMFAAPTKAEAIDWLESKGMCIVVVRRTINNKVGWRYVIYSQTEIISGFSTRLQAEGAAIINALKLLNGKEE